MELVWFDIKYRKKLGTVAKCFSLRWAIIPLILSVGLRAETNSRVVMEYYMFLLAATNVLNSIIMFDYYFCL